MRGFLRLGKTFLLSIWGTNDYPIVLRVRAFALYAAITVVVFAMLFGGKVGDSEVFFAALTQELILGEVNISRSADGLGLLQHDERLQRAAEMKAEDMVARNYFNHVGPNNEKPWIWLDRVEYPYSAAAENLAIDAADPAALVQAWLTSPAHAESFQNGYFDDIGIGIKKGELQGRKTTVVVVFLGKEIDPSVFEEEENDADSVAGLSGSGIPPVEIEKYNEAEFADILAEEPVAVALEKDELVEGKIKAMNITSGEIAKEYNFTGVSISRSDTMSGVAVFVRGFVSALYVLFIGLTFLVAVRFRHKPFFTVWRTAGFSALLLLLWSVEIF